MNGTRIVSVGTAVPEEALDNRELAPRLGLDETWIEERTGIRSRRIAAPSETSSTLGATASARALKEAGLDARDVDLIICATVTPDFRFPATACLIQHALDAKAAAFDLNGGCSGFLYGLAQADAVIRSGGAEHVLVVGAETLSRITDWDDPKTAILFGDGAGAVVVGPSETGSLGGFQLFSDGARPELLWVDPATDKIRMQGREVYRAAVMGMTGAVARLLEDSGLSVADIDLVVGHQANVRILGAVAERLGLPAKKMFTNIAGYGNTSAASIPIALAEAEASGRLEDGDVVVLTAFGAGFVWGAGFLRWSPGLHEPRQLIGAVKTGV